jgi:hypothetical protein
MCVGPGFDQVTGRGMITQATNDTYGTPERIARLAGRTGARVAPLEGGCLAVGSSALSSTCSRS